MNPEDQIILIDKPAGISSFGVVAKVRGFLRAKFGHKVKVGHTGTLDPFATGLLIILTGKNTKKTDEFLKKDKIYEATLKLGYTSTTGDPEGEIHAFHDTTSKDQPDHPIATPTRATVAPPTGATITPPTRAAIESVLASFTGETTQTPPKFSAIKIDGRRAYQLARQGKDFELPSRKVTIYSIEILDYHYPELRIRTHVSSGTYIRTLAEDIGESIGTGAYLTALRRTKIAGYDVKDALPLSDFVV